MRFRSTVKRFDNQQSSDTLHAKLSKGENGAICNITRLSLRHCSAFDTDRHFVEWRSLAGILISRRHYILFEKTNGCLILSLRARAPEFPLMKGKTSFDTLSSSQERQYVWLACSFFFFKIPIFSVHFISCGTAIRYQRPARQLGAITTRRGWNETEGLWVTRPARLTEKSVAWSN